MIRLDREARRKAGRDVLEAAGIAPDKIELVLASPPGKKTKEKKKKVAPDVAPQRVPAVVAVPDHNPVNHPQPAVLVPPAPRHNPLGPALPVNNRVLNPRENVAAAQPAPRQVVQAIEVPANDVDRNVVNEDNNDHDDHDNRGGGDNDNNPDRQNVNLPAQPEPVGQAQVGHEDDADNDLGRRRCIIL